MKSHADINSEAPNLKLHNSFIHRFIYTSGELKSKILNNLGDFKLSQSSTFAVRQRQQ